MKKHIFCASAFSFLLAACGGGSDSGSTEPVDAGTPEATVQATYPGVWIGDVQGIDGLIYTGFGLVAPNGEARFTSVESVETVVAQTRLLGSDVSSTSGAYFLNQEYTTGASIEAKITNDTMVGEVTADTGEVVSFEVVRQPESDNGADLATISGNFVDAEMSASISVDTDGEITGSDVDGCLYTGQVSITDESLNVYTVDLAVDNCSFMSGQYEGLAAYTEEVIDGDNVKALVVSVDNDDYEVSRVLFKTN